MPRPFSRYHLDDWVLVGSEVMFKALSNQSTKPNNDGDMNGQWS